jgi:hypothetical protein
VSTATEDGDRLAATDDGSAVGHVKPENRVEAVHPWLFWPLTLIGAGILGFGVYGIWTHANMGLLGVPLRPWLTWFIGAVLLHDLVIAPIALAIGRGLRVVRPLYLRAPLQIGIALTVLIPVLMFPLLRGYGANNQPGNASVLPKDYATGLVVILALVWLSMAGLAWWRRRRETATDDA